MRSPQRSADGDDSLRRAVFVGLFTGTAVGVGYLLSGVPNVELMTLLTALAGAALGARSGALCGALSAAVFSLANPLGPALPPLLAAQCGGLAVAGWLGACGGGRVGELHRRGRSVRAAAVAALLGGAATLVFDIATNLAAALAFDIDWRVAVVGGLPFTTIHVGVNVALFGVLFPWLADRVARLRRSSVRGGRAAMGVLLWLTLLAAPARSIERDSADAGSLGEPRPASRPGVVVAPRDTTATDEPPAVAPPDSGAAAAESPVERTGVPEEGSVEPLTSGAEAAAARAARAAESSRRFQRKIERWERPLWEPAARSFVDETVWRSPWLPVVDGGLGAPIVLLHEGGTSPLPLVVRDGVPQLVGHRLADDPAIVPITGLVLTDYATGRDGWGGSDGRLTLQTIDLTPTEAVAEARFDDANHDQNQRSFALLTKEAPWRLQFAFEELIDGAGWDFRPPGDGRFSDPNYTGRLGRAKFRSGRGSLIGLLDDGSEFALRFENVRQNRIGLPAYDRDEEEIWSRQVALSWHGPVASAWLNSVAYWTDRDVEFDFSRKIEAAREGLRLELADAAAAPSRRIWLALAGWRLHDSGTTIAWAAPDTGRLQGRGTDVQVAAESRIALAGLALRAGAAALWSEPAGGWAPEAWLSLASAAAPLLWRLELERGGRAPRSDELLTPWTFAVPGRDIRTRPAADLEREKTWRAALRLERRLLGTDLAVFGALRWLRDGIGWRPAGGSPPTGVWANDVALNARIVTVSAQRGQSLLGWLRVRGLVNWRSFEVTAGRRFDLPPEFDARVQVLWENHFFAEDGVLQLGYQLFHRGPLNDPWSLDEPFPLSALTRHDALVGFRLIGVHLSLVVANLTDTRNRLSAGAESFGRELQWRLRWVFHR
jgi:hypothetical protein